MAGNENGRRRDALAILRPFARFVDTEMRSGTMLGLAVLVAVVWANSPWKASYAAIWGLPIAIDVGGHAMAGDLRFWINDLLMAVFFLLVGLEIKRELVLGELNSARRAALPAIAALGGMIVPAGLYALIAGRGPSAPGWGIPMATDIAFAIGVARLLGSRVPSALLVFLTAFAIIDDLGAVVVIALFYGGKIAWGPLAGALAMSGVLAAMGRFGVRRGAVYALVGLPLWLLLHEGGVHATLAGVIVGMCVPTRSVHNVGQAIAEAKAVAAASGGEQDAESQQVALEVIEHHVEQAQSPLLELAHALHPYVAYGIIPVFALANAGVDLGGASLAMLAEPVSLGIIVGLVVGKPIGIFAASYAAVRAGLAELPSAVTWRHMLGAGMLGGIGFTMSLFVGGLAFLGDATLYNEAKVGVLTASLLAAVVGSAYLTTDARRAVS